VLAAHRRTADAAGVNWKPAIYQQVREEVRDNEFAIERMCELAGVSRRGFYRFDPEVRPGERDMDLRDEIQRIALEMPSYGRPRITAELRRRGWVVNAKRVHRILREDNLLCLRRRKFLVTTDSRHGFAIYPNLAGALQLTNVNQLWIADITYIRLEAEFVYLAVVLDAFSRRVIGWALDRTLEAKLTVAALQMALSRRSGRTRLVHHSDRGVQYAADDYISLLAQHDIQISMSRKGNPYDNARTESFIKTLKYEEVYRQEYRDLPDALRSLRRFLEKIYNEKRLHSALGYLPPSEFEANLLLANNCKEAASRQVSV
jgi:transposase InsO family protein